MKKRVYFIYKYTFPNGKVYIGQTYKGSGRYGTLFGYRTQLVYRAMKKYPNYEKEILEYCTLENVDERERFYIDKYKSMDKAYGYNREGGGNENKIRSIETKRLISSLHGGESVVQYDLQGKFIERWDYVSEAANKVGANPDLIYKCCRGKAKTAGGFRWAFAKDNKNSLERYQRGEAHNKCVYQFDLEGVFIKKWDSLKMVEQELGIGHGSISSCCQGKLKSTGGFMWSFTKNCPSYKKQTKAKAVFQYELSGEFIKEWKSASEAAMFYHIDRRLINACCNGQQKSAGNYQWSYNQQERIDKWFSKEPPVRVIQQLSVNDVLINEFASISDAARSLGVTVTSIHNCLKGKSKTSHGFKWEYKE